MIPQIRYSPNAETDIEELFYVITNLYDSPLAAGRYIQGIYNAYRQ